MSQGPVSDFDLMNALDWRDGIATLPGSHIRFRLSEFGTLEIITDSDSVVTATLPQSGQALGTDTHTSSVSIFSQVIKIEDKDPEMEKKTTEESLPTVQPAEEQPTVPVPPTVASGSSTYIENERPQRLRRKRKLLMDSGDEEDLLDDEEMNHWHDKIKANLKSRKTSKQTKTAPPPKKKLWNWVSYLEEEKMPAVPLKCFKEHQSFPQSRNNFRGGMKLEGIDPEHPSLYCVLTVAEVQGYRMRLHFDGYPDCYDFWVNADSVDIHPVGWCERTGHKLLPPKGYKDGEFSWAAYLKHCKAQGAPKTLFKSYNTPVTPSGFRAAMKLEAVDRKNPSLLCVATISDIVENRLLIHFDSWDHSYDYWCDASSPYIRPVGYCQESAIALTPPPEYKDPKCFTWEAYLEKNGAQAAPARAFKPRPPHGYQPQMKLEAVDQRNPMLIRVCSTVQKDDNRIKLHFDGWSSLYDFWVDVDSPDIHPVGWCAKTGHALQLPPGASDMAAVAGQGCPIAGCTGIGHVRGSRYGTHYTAVGCPYSEVNLNRENLLQDRLSGERPSPVQNATRSRRPGTPSPTTDSSDFPQSRKSPIPVEERWGRSNPWEGTEWLEEETETKPQIKRGSHTYIRLQIIKQETDGTDCEVSLEQALHQSVFMTSLSSDPGHRIHMCWEQQCYLLPEVSSYTAQSVGKWSADEVAQFVHQLPGCTEQSSVFRDEQIDGEAFLLLTQNDLVKILGLKLGPALKIYNSILMFHTLTQD
eukprot:XP_002939531.2 PREDICTED: lethal(3)malignant brain tumor-like protein 3 isoform X2 [Xenopus tropicalis]